MKKFLVQNIYFLFQFLCVFFFFLSLYLYSINITYDTMPALNFSNSYSLNEKVLFMKNYDKKPQIISVGSSMTLNNLYSEVVVEKMNSDKYLNTASWGSSMGDNFYFIQLLTCLYNPKSMKLFKNYKK